MNVYITGQDMETEQFEDAMRVDGYNVSFQGSHDAGTTIAVEVSGLAEANTVATAAGNRKLDWFILR